MQTDFSIRLYEIIEILKQYQEIFCIGFGMEEQIISNAASLRNAEANSIVWIASNRSDKENLIANTKARTIVTDESVHSIETSFSDKIFLIVEDPRLTFIRICNLFFINKPQWKVHPTAVIHPEAKIHSQVYIGPYAVVGNCEIDTDTQIMGHCLLYDNVKIGKNVIIHAGTVIGADGFGYQRNKYGKFEKFPHLGGVIIEDDVEIGSNTCIDRGTLDDTIIRTGAKIDNLVHIAHNVVIGQHAAVIAHAMIGGGTIIEDGAWIAPSASIRDGIRIGVHATIGMGAVVTKSVPVSETWTGNPAKELSAFIALQQKLK